MYLKMARFLQFVCALMSRWTTDSHERCLRRGICCVNDAFRKDILKGAPFWRRLGWFDWVILCNSLMFKKCWPLDVCCCHFRWIPGGGGAWKLSMLNGQLAWILLNHLSDVKEVLLVARKIGVGKIPMCLSRCVAKHSLCLAVAHTIFTKKKKRLQCGAPQL